MTSRVMLISPAISAALREARFDDDCPLDASGLRLARAAAHVLPSVSRVWVSPTARCHETAQALGLDAGPASGPGGLDAGRWRGSTLTEVAEKEPEALAQWLADPNPPRTAASQCAHCATGSRAGWTTRRPRSRAGPSW